MYEEFLDALAARQRGAEMCIYYHCRVALGPLQGAETRSERISKKMGDFKHPRHYAATKE